MKPGETVAILGASGGAGQAAIEIAKLMGARVIACASSPDKLDLCRALGADDVLNYDDGDLKENLRALTGGRGPDVVYDCVGDKFAEPAVRALAWGGRFLVVGFAAGEIPKIPLNLFPLEGHVCGRHFVGQRGQARSRITPANMIEVLVGWQQGS